MKLEVDTESDVVRLLLDEASIVESEEVQPGVILDYNAEGKVVGLEILGVTTRVPAQALCTLQFETA